MKANTIIRRFGRFAACVAMLAAAACTGNFEDYNTKPFRPSDDDLNGDNVGVGILFPAMMEFVTHFQVNASQMHDVLVADELGGYASAVKSYQGQNIATYNPSDKFNDYIFEQTFANFYGNYFKVETQTGGEGPVYQLARILRVAAMLRVTDAYGPIPYSKMQNGTFSVPYDSQRDVYMAMIDDLDAAMETLYTFASAGDGILMRDFDISSFKGDSRLWVSFANTLKLRMAIRMSGVEPEARRIAEEAVRDMATYGLIDANAENLSFSSDSRQNPFYTQATSTSWQDLRSNASIVMYMNAYEDPRRASYFSKSGYDGIYVGVRAGIQNVTPTDYATYSYPLFAEKDPVPGCTLRKAGSCAPRALCWAGRWATRPKTSITRVSKPRSNFGETALRTRLISLPKRLPRSPMRIRATSITFRISVRPYRSNGLTTATNWCASSPRNGSPTI